MSKCTHTIDGGGFGNVHPQHSSHARDEGANPPPEKLDAQSAKPKRIRKPKAKTAPSS